MGFEVDPRSVAYESLERLENGRCSISQDMKVMELYHSESEGGREGVGEGGRRELKEGRERGIRQQM